MKHEPGCGALRCKFRYQNYLPCRLEEGESPHQKTWVSPRHHLFQPGPGDCIYCWAREAREKLNAVANNLDREHEWLCGDLCEVIDAIDKRLGVE